MYFNYRKFNCESKYKNHKAEVDGIVFDSKKEAKRWQELIAMQELGEITELERQVAFELIPVQRGNDGKVIERKCEYRADFVYLQNGEKVVEDTKGMETEAYKIKRKLFLYKYGIVIKDGRKERIERKKARKKKGGKPNIL